MKRFVAASNIFLVASVSKVTCVIMKPYAAGETCVSCQLHACSLCRRFCIMFFKHLSMLRYMFFTSNCFIGK
jgi:hypothetical protein